MVIYYFVKSKKNSIPTNTTNAQGQPNNTTWTNPVANREYNLFNWVKNKPVYWDGDIGGSGKNNLYGLVTYFPAGAKLSTLQAGIMPYGTQYNPDGTLKYAKSFIDINSRITNIPVDGEAGVWEGNVWDVDIGELNRAGNATYFLRNSIRNNQGDNPIRGFYQLK